MPEELSKLQTSDSQSWADRRQRLRQVTLHTWAFPVGIVAALLGLLLYNTLYPSPLPLSQNDVDDSIAQVIASVTPPPAYSAQVYQAILPSLVFIKSEGPNPENDENVSVGSGVVINESGLILTA
ncbi:MAG: hypothetical protein R3264_21190, partial [Anaerolineae bacterium]|nr:hypothetical protein [Anaerolineae bacterium]